MYGVTRAPFNSNRSSCGIEVGDPLFSHPKFETPSKVFRSDARRPTYGARQSDGNDPAGDIYPPDRNSPDAGDPPVPFDQSAPRVAPAPMRRPPPMFPPHGLRHRPIGAAG